MQALAISFKPLAHEKGDSNAQETAHNDIAYEMHGC